MSLTSYEIGTGIAAASRLTNYDTGIGINGGMLTVGSAGMTTPGTLTYDTGIGINGGMLTVGSAGMMTPGTLTYDTGIDINAGMLTVGSAGMTTPGKLTNYDTGIGINAGMLTVGSPGMATASILMNHDADIDISGTRVLTGYSADLGITAAGRLLSYHGSGNLSVYPQPSLEPGHEYYAAANLRWPSIGANEAIYWHPEIQNRQQQFSVKLPLRFNNGKDVPAKWLEEAKLELTDLFGGVSFVVGGGLWKHEGRVFPDDWLWIMVEAPDLDRNERLMKDFKERWRSRLGQVDLRVTSQEVKIL